MAPSVTHDVGSAIPMLTRCWHRQWAGLDPSDRALITAAWGDGRHGCPQLGVLSNTGTRPQSVYPIWTVASAMYGPLHLVAVKED